MGISENYPDTRQTIVLNEQINDDHWCMHIISSYWLKC